MGGSIYGVRGGKDSRGISSKEGNQSNFLNHLLPKKGQKGIVKQEVGIVKQEAHLAYNRMFKPHILTDREAAESCNYCQNPRQI